MTYGHTQVLVIFILVLVYAQANPKIYKSFYFYKSLLMVFLHTESRTYYEVTWEDCVKKYFVPVKKLPFPTFRRILRTELSTALYLVNRGRKCKH